MSTNEALHKALSTCLERSLTFAAFRTPGKPAQIWAQRTPELEGVQGTLLLGLNQVFLVAPFLLDHGNIPFIRADVELMFAEIDPDITPLDGCMGAPQGWRTADAPTSREAFTGAVQAAAQACAQRRLDKVVLSRVVEAPITPQQWPALFLQAMTESPDAFVAMVHTPAHGTWMGASPERLVHEESDHVRVDAIAATRPVNAVPERLSAWGLKELDEHEQVVTHVHGTFARMDLANITVRGPGVLRAGPVAHLHTVADADLADTLLGDLVLALHPTPAVCGSPTGEARQFIAAHEQHDRSLYTGFWGPWNADGPTDIFVNLRCMRLADGCSQLLVGAGITAGSDAAMEWEETARKAQTWLRLMETSPARN